jgi:elongation factor Ts
MFSPFYLGRYRRKTKEINDKIKSVEPESKPVIYSETKIEKPKETTSVKDLEPKQETLLPNNNQKNNMTITTEQIKELRDQTGVSVMQCKKALEEAGGDKEKALVILRKKSGEISAKKSDRTFGSGTIQSYIHANGSVGSMVELNCETDFVANNDGFKTLARDIAMHVAATNPKFLKIEDITDADKQTAKEVFEKEVAGKPDAMKEKILEGKLSTYFSEMVLLNQPFIRNPDMTIQALVDNAVQKYGEKIAVGRFICFRILER